MSHQPLLHDLLSAIAAPTQVWTDTTGTLAGHGAQGVYHCDVRVLRRAVVTVTGEAPESTGAWATGGEIRSFGLARNADGPGADPTVAVEINLRATPGQLAQNVVLASALRDPVTAILRIDLASDLATMETIKTGRGRGADRPAQDLGDARLRWSDGTVTATLEAPRARLDLRDPAAPALEWDVVVPPRGSITVGWTLTAADSRAVVSAAHDRAQWTGARVRCDDPRLDHFLARSLDDLDGLRMSHRDTPDDVFLAAGAPWFFTLFGRDSIVAARMLLPLGTDLAAGTLRTLAHLQGTRTDPDTAEQPGKIPHEVRRESLDLGDGTCLPPVYYGTVDATPLWICLLHDAWRWGMPDSEVRGLLPNLQAALSWMADHGDADGDGFLEYVDATGRGLANQGWKDSGDSIQFRDGRLAVGPIALAEVQGYAYEAALAGASLLDAFGLPGADGWRSWAAALAERFRATFWIADEVGPYPGIALDKAKNVVDIVASNMGHLLGTGILCADEADIVAARLGHPELDSGYGLRTMATSSAGYWPLKYHGGSVWTHDTGIAILGLARTGHDAEAASFIEGVLAAAEGFGYRMPELYSGSGRDEVARALPYPAACHPQAWSAATAVALVTAVLGLEPGQGAAAPGGLRVAPLRPSPVGALEAEGIVYAGRPVRIAVAADGTPQEPAGPTKE